MTPYYFFFNFYPIEATHDPLRLRKAFVPVFMHTNDKHITIVDYCVCAKQLASSSSNFKIVATSGFRYCFTQ